MKTKDFLELLHNVRKKNKMERKRRGISGQEWLEESKEVAEKLLGHSIPEVNRKMMPLILRDRPRKSRRR